MLFCPHLSPIKQETRRIKRHSYGVKTYTSNFLFRSIMTHSINNLDSLNSFTHVMNAQNVGTFQ
ncbi:hypothetical protein HMPREF9138_02340 [Prevotella histicola F0411]|uniref:Uncharacterized protein n=1 Tax=Prevotella histicola F0411 TaxID=857291 RepID=G6AJR3_9BACT|nr:hypothetical protein HMPREF9138_02340 [Prevotella histicola F0411]